MLAIANGKSKIKLIDIETNACLNEFEGCAFSLLQGHINMAFSPDSTLLAYRWEKGVRIMDVVDNYKIVKEFDN